MTETKPLYLYGAKPHHLAAVKAAKEGLGLDVLLQPTLAMPGQYGRVLAFGEHPGWVCESLLVTGPEMAVDAIKWALGMIEMSHDDYAAKLSRWMGAEVRGVS